ncbi:MAG: magnesium transporter [Planctomycetota bacterium]
MANPTVNLLEPELRALIERRAFRQIRDALSGLEPADIADLIEQLDPDEAVIVFRVLPRALAADTFAEMVAEASDKLLNELGDERAARLFESMDPDDRAAALDELPIEVSGALLRRFSPENRRVTQAILGYDAESVGRLMTPDYVRVRPDWTVAHALDHIRRYGKDAETVHWVYVIDHERTLLDDIHIRHILLADPESSIRDLMDDEFLSLRADEDREEAVRMMLRYDRTALPVVDGLGLLVGIVTHDDVADVAEEEFTEDVQKLGGMDALDLPYTETSIRAMFRKRGGWLAGLFVMQILTIAVMSYFDDQLSRAVVLVVFVPLIIASGGNTGTQAASLIVRAIAVDEVHFKDWWRICRKEILTGLLLGFMLGVIGVVTVWMLSLIGFIDTPHVWPLAFTVGGAVQGIVLWGTLVGSMLPLIMERLGLDPAASSSPLVATIMDVSGLTIYFLCAMALLRGTLL